MKRDELIELMQHGDIALRLLAARSFYEFVKQAWPHVESVPYVDNWHVKLICDHLQAVIDGGVKDLLINGPPACGKSGPSNTFLVPWAWTRNPAWRFMYASYGEDLSLRDSENARRLIKSKWYQQRWGKRYRLREGSDAKRKFETDKGGYRMATSVGGRATGEHPDFLVGTDLHKADHASSPAELQSAIDFWNVTLGTRGISRGSRRILEGQRICRGDVSDHAKSHRKYVEVILPMEFVPGAMQPTQWGMDPRTEPGELLFPQIVGRDTVDALKQMLGWRAAAQLQQDPQSPEGAIYDAKHFRRVRLAGDQEWGRGLPRGMFELLDIEGNVVARFSPAECFWLQTLDYACKTKTMNDWTVVGTFAITPGGDLIVFHIHRERVKIPQQFALAMAMRQRFPFVSVQAVEDAAGGISVIQEGVDKGIDFHVLKATRDKVDRAGPISRYYAQGKVCHLEAEPWLPDFETELLQFPGGVHDDQADVAAWAGQYMLERSLARAGVYAPDDVKALPDVRAKVLALVEKMRGAEAGSQPPSETAIRRAEEAKRFGDGFLGRAG